MKTSQTPVLRYGPTYTAKDAATSGASEDEPGRDAERASKVNEVVTWAVLGVCLAGWSVIGLFLWIPRLLRAVVLFSAALVQSTVEETGAAPAGRRLRSAANFYKRGFVGAVASIRSALDRDVHDDEADGAWKIEPRVIVRETVWAVVVWYVILWPLGVIQVTPLDLVSSVVDAPWAEMWSGTVEAITSIPSLFRG